MIHFQDALKQKGDTYSGWWVDEGVYRIAKEVQLVKPDQFNNIFLGLGGFHMEKIVLACLGTYLEPSGIFAEGSRYVTRLAYENQAQGLKI